MNYHARYTPKMAWQMPRAHQICLYVPACCLQYNPKINGDKRREKVSEAKKDEPDLSALLYAKRDIVALDAFWHINKFKLAKKTTILIAI